MSCQGVYFRMQDDAPSKPFRNCAQILVSKEFLIYSAYPMPGKTRRVQIPITWRQDSGFTVNWSRVCRYWSKAAAFQRHSANGVRGLLEQGRHFWRYDPAATEEMQKTATSDPRRTVPSGCSSTFARGDDAATRKVAPSSSTTAYLKPHSNSKPALHTDPYGVPQGLASSSPWPDVCHRDGAVARPKTPPPSEPTEYPKPHSNSKPALDDDPYGVPQGLALSSPWPDVFTRDGAVATPKTAAPSEPRECHKFYKICQCNFDWTEYGSEYMRLTVGDKILGVGSPEESNDWAYGCKLLADNTLSEPGWYPRAFAEYP